MSSPGMIGLCGPLFVFLLCFVSFSCTETTTTNFNAPADQIQPATSEAANYRERAVDEFGSRVNRLVVGDLPRRAQKRIKKALKIIRKELRRDDYEPSKVARGFAALFKAIEKATAQKGAHLVTVLRLKQKKTLRRLIRLLRRANREVDDDGGKEKVGRYLDMISEKRQRFKNDFETNFEATRKNLGETLSDLVAVIHSINLPITPDWRRKLEHGHEIVIRRLDSARQVLENEDANIGRLLSRTTLVVRQGGSKGRQISSIPSASPSAFSLPSESESESTDPEESALGQLQARFEKNNRKSSDLISQVTGLKAAHHYTNDNDNNDDNNNANTGVGGLHFAFQLPAGDKGNLDDDVNSMDRSEEEEERRRLRRLEGKKLEWNFRVEDPLSQSSSNEVSEEEEPAPDVVGRLMQAQKGMDRITKVHERQMSRLLHELVMSGMVTHSKLIRFVNRFEFSHDRRQHRLGKRLRKVIDIRRAQRILHERRLFSLNRERQEDSFLYNRLILRSIQSLGIHELSVELGKRKWGRKYLRSQVVKNLVRQNKLSSLAKIQNLYRLKHELQVRNQLRSRQQRKALRRVARATGIPLSALPQLPLLKPGGGLILSLRKKSGGRRGGRREDRDEDEDGDGVADEDDDAPNYEELFSDKEDEEEEEQDEEAENQFQEYDDNDDDDNNDYNNDKDGDDETEDRRTDSEKEEDEHLDLEEVVEFIRKARREQEELLARHRNYVKELKRELRGEREEELDELNKIEDQDELFEALIDFSRREKRRQEREVDRYELMIEELKVNLRDQLEEIEKTEEYVCGLDSFTGLCPKREEPEGPSCDRYHGYGSYLLEFLNKLYAMRKTHREERKQLIEKLSDLEKEAEKPPKERKKKWRDEEAEDPYAALERSRGRGRGRARGSEDGGNDMGIAIRGPSDAHTYEVVGLAPNYEEDDDTENDTDNTKTNNSDDDDDEDEEKEIVSVNELLRLLRGLVYFSIDEEKKERDFIKDVLARHERIHDLIMTLVERYHYEWVKIFDDEDSDLSDEEKMRDGIQDLVKLFRLARAFARKSKRDEIKLIDRISDRREELELRIEEVQKAFDAWQRYYGAVSAKVDGLLGVIVNKQSEQENAEMEIMKLLDARREEEEDEEEAVLAALHKFRKGKYDERAEKRSFKLLIFKKNKKF